jgi:polar amino acid transport system substrate-binding protein
MALLLSLALSLACLVAPCAAADTSAAVNRVAVCDDENELPPFSYDERADDNAGNRKTGMITGYTVAVLREIFSRRGITFSIDMKPWPRCLAVTTLGKEYAMVMNVTYSAERARSFLLTRPYYSLTSYYYYLHSAHPIGLSIGSPADLHNFSVCGISGHNDEGYGMASPF